MKTSLLVIAFAVIGATLTAQNNTVTFTVRSAHSGKWSAPATWMEKRLPKSGDYVQIRAGHSVTYDVSSDERIRMIHVAGTLTFARDTSTRLEVGLIKIQPGDEASEDGFDCNLHPDPQATIAENPNTKPALEIGTQENPLPANVSATIRLVYFDGTNKETLPAIINCGGRWDVHGAPMSRTWLKLAATAKEGDSAVALEEPVSGWKEGDKVIITGSREVPGSSFRIRKGGTTEERIITKIDGANVTLDVPLRYEHWGGGDMQSEVANLSRNVIIESANPDGVRGHTMYHRNSSGGISYTEFRHLGKEGVLGKYSIHFHLVRDTMRGSGVLGASIWDSHNRWITIHGTDYLLIRDCIGYQSVGHGFFLEDATEQYNILDRNLAVQAYQGRQLPQQVLPFDSNDGAGFWWANGRNTFIRNVSCENDEYGFRFEIARRSNFDPDLIVRMPGGEFEKRDVRTLTFLRFEDNESHTEGLYSFNFGDDENPAVRGDRQHPFIARNLRAWETHYVLRPNVQFFLMDGLKVHNGVYGVYHPDYDAHVYRNIEFDNVNAEPINRGHDDESVQNGTFTYDNVTLENCQIGRDPLIQMACTSPRSGQTGHFRNLTIRNSESRMGSVVDLGGGPRNPKLENGVAYYFYDYFGSGHITKVVSERFPDMMRDAEYKSIAGFTGPGVRAADVTGVSFPRLLDPVDDLPPATMITSIRRVRAGHIIVRGVSQDNGEIASVTVNKRPARIISQHAGVADWEIDIPTRLDTSLTAAATDRAGNVEKTAHDLAR